MRSNVRLRIALSLVCGFISLALIALWVQSYWWFDTIHYRPTNSTYLLAWSQEGAIIFCNESRDVNLLGDPPGIGWTFSRSWGVVYTSDIASVPTFWKVFRGFRPPPTRPFSQHIPYWFLVLFTVALGAAPWKWQFSLRTLLIATTLVAMALGAVVAFSRSS